MDTVFFLTFWCRKTYVWCKVKKQESSAVTSAWTRRKTQPL